MQRALYLRKKLVSTDELMSFCLLTHCKLIFVLAFRKLGAGFCAQ